MGVTELTVTGWETNRMTPMIAHLPRIISFLGYTPAPYDKKSDNISDRIKLYRHTHGLSQKKFANLIGVDETTVAKWELGKRKPSKKITEKLENVTNNRFE